MEAEAARPSEAARTSSVVRRPHRLGGVLDHRDAVSLSNLQDWLHLGGVAGEMDRDDRPGSGRDGALEERRIHAEILAPRIDDGMRARLGAYLVPAFGQLFERHYAGAAAPHVPAIETLGVEDRRDATKLFIDVVNDVILPRLDAFDLPGREAVQAALAPSAHDDGVVWAATD